jgi:hypothetical protein
VQVTRIVTQSRMQGGLSGLYHCTVIKAKQCTHPRTARPFRMQRIPHTLTWHCRASPRASSCRMQDAGCRMQDAGCRMMPVCTVWAASSEHGEDRHATLPPVLAVRCTLDTRLALFFLGVVEHVEVIASHRPSCCCRRRSRSRAWILHTHTNIYNAHTRPARSSSPHGVVTRTVRFRRVSTVDRWLLLFVSFLNPGDIKSC